MSLEKTLKNVGKVFAGIVLATALTFCQNETTTKDEDEEDYDEPQPITRTGDIQGRVVYPIVENNSLTWKGKEDAIIFIDGISSGKSIADGLFYLSGIKTGAHNLKANYLKQFLSEEMGIPVYDGKLTTITKDIQMIPSSDENEIVYGVVYTDSTKSSLYNGRLRLANNSQPITDVSDGIYAFQGSVEGRNIIEDSTGKIVIFFDETNPADEHYTVEMGDDWIAKQNGYINDKSLYD
ncbi:hypothetical protein M0R72_04855 [Candidatus Pacearchaeota archaeon]|jgi:hypothetical protein|nr:hypothetical protein [Candidatus Pacearchaeota archaeon]